MGLIGSWIKNNPIRTLFLIPIILVAAISISHVVTWYSIANPINWAIYLSIAIEVGAMTALVAATNRVKGGVWFMFGLVTFIQMVGNIYFSFKEIDETGELWYSWIELTTPVWEMMGTELTDTVSLKRWLAFLEGGLLPIISLTSLHFFVKYNKVEDEEKEENQEIDMDKMRQEIKEELLVELLRKETAIKEETNEEESTTTPTEVEVDETDYLLSSEANKTNLEESIEQAEEIKDLYGENKSEGEIVEEEILKKALDEYNEKKSGETKTTVVKNSPTVIQTQTGKVKFKKAISKNIQRID